MAYQQYFASQLYLPREKLIELAPRNFRDKYGPENFVKASDVRDTMEVPEDGPAEVEFRIAVYKYLDEQG